MSKAYEKKRNGWQDSIADHTDFMIEQEKRRRAESKKAVESYRKTFKRGQ